ncbi:5-methylthioadenosine/S-adenosylhomocysteine deaminase [Pelosinus fermentans]|uniref:amidohydrolase n=1 Tax=Pelosinus fermentans TaxID=365349 RepID=UPI0002684F8F|nr:amidohydrolase [Pelosinus fermentans]OAM96298.1 5-methylthioadenosine/S-adenosylhomocysteine deaminase [Pelosinus fermentans DSM 17108]SDR38580.1 5-methylthioadenosine/S-adenosylhomocysteine deaminase [Pelosinus fermentans]
MNIIVKNGTVLTHENGFIKSDILIKDGVIAKIDEIIEEEAETVVDASDQLVLPGLVNCHNHAAMSLFRGYSDDLRLMDWLEKRIWPIEDQMSEDDVYWCTLLAITEMIKTGTTTFADMYFHMEAVASAVSTSGIRASLCRGLIPQGRKRKDLLRSVEDFTQKYHKSSDGRITCMIGPHAPFTCPPDFLEEVLSVSDLLNIPIHIHLAETSEEVEQIYAQYKKSPTRYLYDLKVFDRKCLLAHSVNLSRDDVHLMIGKDVSISHNPVSNMKLGCGVAPIPLMLKLGINVALGTDGLGSASTLDMFEEIKAVAWMQKNHHGDPTILEAPTLMKMATSNGAQALGITDVGEIKIGNKADIIIVTKHTPRLHPLRKDNILASLCYSVNGADVTTSIVNGNVLMKDRKILTYDELEVYKKVQEISNKLLGGIV